MLASFFFVLFGAFCLYLGAEWLIKSSLSLSKKWKTTPLFAGLLLVGFGTSMPELIVTLQANLKNYPTMAMANIVGSNLFNTAFILGLSLLIKPVFISANFRKFDAPVLLFCCGLLWILGAEHHLGRLWGMFLVLLLSFYSYGTYYFSKKEQQKKTYSIDTPIWDWKIGMCLLPIGLAVLIVGAELFLKGAISIAEHFQLSEAIIGLTLVAIGTSLPELATSLLAACRGHGSIVLGNIVGSNIYNVLGILGITSLVKPLGFKDIHLLDFITMLGVNALFVFGAFFFRTLSKKMGALLLGSYFIYLFYLLQRV